MIQLLTGPFNARAWQEQSEAAMIDGIMKDFALGVLLIALLIWATVWISRQRKKA